ncbi:MAG: uncharacterized membrane protein YjgN (DUF898 family) [Polaribacter sp.]|jgi:uncharacterized membrane protein YjgN (DUF898 family)
MEMNEPIQSTNNPNERRPFSFTGQGSRFFGIWAVNIILTIITLGLYYPWAKAAVRRFMWNETTVAGDRFVFHGTGKEMFRGFIIAYGIIFGLIALIFVFPMGIILFYIALLVLGPIAIYGGWRYRMSRTSYRGIYFSFKGDMQEFVKLYLKNLFLTIITLGFYAPWMIVKVMKYLVDRTRLGDMEFSFEGEGDKLFVINIVGVLLSMLTLGIYSFWWMAKRFNFTFSNIVMHHNNGSDAMISKLKGEDVLVVTLVNSLLLIFTLGLAFPWAMMRIMELYASKLAIPAEVDLDSLQQDADDYKDATGDDLLDVLDMGLEF